MWTRTHDLWIVIKKKTLDTRGLELTTFWLYTLYHNHLTSQ